MAVKNYGDECVAFLSSKKLSDCALILDDNSNTPFSLKMTFDGFLGNGVPSEDLAHPSPISNSLKRFGKAIYI